MTNLVYSLHLQNSAKHKAVEIGSLKLTLLLALVLSMILNGTAFAQVKATDSGGEVETVQPTIMVIPYTKESEDIRTIMESDPNIRIAISNVKEAFDAKGARTIDFVAKLKAAQENKILQGNTQSDIKSELLQFAGPDIFVECEIVVVNGSNGENAVRVILQAFETSTGMSLSNKTGDSGKYYTTDISKLATFAIGKVVDDFLKVMNESFQQIILNGKNVSVTFSLLPESKYTFDTEIGPDLLPLSDAIELWLEKAAYKNNYHPQGKVGNKLIYDIVKIPVKDQATGNNYTPSKFSLEIFKFMREIGVPCTKDVKGSSILITIK
jgi:hypothetical protein